MIRLAVSGRLQGLLDYLRRPYCCSGVAASAVAADKALCKLAMTGLGVATPRWRLADADGRSFARQCVQVMVKPRLGGSSVVMALARTGEELNEAISAATAIDPVGVTPAPGTAAVRGGAGRHGTAWPVWRAGAAPLGSITDAS